MMWFFLLLLFLAHLGPVNLQGEPKWLIIKDDKEPCKGHVEIYYKKTWGYVGNNNWNENAEKVVCKSTHCGTRVNSTGYGLRPLDGKVWLDDVKCKGNEKQLWDCGEPEWDISHQRDDTFRTFECSNKVSIKLEPHKCAGVVKYSIEGGTSGYFCPGTWGINEANLLCKSLGCGDAEKIPEYQWFGWKKPSNSKFMTIKCLDTKNLTNLWQCADQESDRQCQKPASVICKGFERVQLDQTGSNVCSGRLVKEDKDGKWTPVKDTETKPETWCEQMHCGRSNQTQVSDSSTVTCSADVQVVLMDKNTESTCYGRVHIKVNDTYYPVCASSPWAEKEAQVVCTEKKCGKMIETNKQQQSPVDGIMDFVTCSGSESSLWHCWGKRDKKPFRCNSYANVVCAGSLDVRLEDGPGTCAGRLEIKHKGQWLRVNDKTWKSPNSDVVCRHLNCGNERKPISPDVKYSKGSGGFLDVTITCADNAEHISECKVISPNPNQPTSQREREDVWITCEKHRMVFLDSNNSCSGLVGIEQGTETSYLSGSNNTWTQNVADTVCREMSCGGVSSRDYTSNADEKKKVWDKAYDCSANSSSLFKCNSTTPSSDHNSSIATVTCKGNTTVTLTKGCWGNVNICTGTLCGGVRNDTWTDKKSEMLCKNLNCGKAMLNAKISVQESNVAFKSVHTTKHTRKLSQSSFIKDEEKDMAMKQYPAFVVCSKSIQTRINKTRDKCCGNVEVFFEGQYLPVCKDALESGKAKNLICEEQKCGQAVAVYDFFGPKPSSGSIKTINCADNVKSLRECDITSGPPSCDLAALQCSGCSKMELKTGTACSGALFVHVGDERRAVSAEGWTDTEANRLCQDLKCGNMRETKAIKPVDKSFWNTSFSCDAESKPESIWACEKTNITPTQKDQLFITCQDKPTISLSESWGGEVQIDGVGVCDTGWNKDYSDLVRKEMNHCRAVWTISKARVPKEEYYHVKCEKYHFKLGQCRRFKAKCAGNLVSISCSFKFSTTEKCGGQILVNYRSKWENVCLTKALDPKYISQLCEGCSKSNGTQPTTKTTLGTTLDCTKGPAKVEDCVRQESCAGPAAMITCPGNVKPTEPPPPPNGTPVLPIIVGVGFLLLVVFLAIVFVRIYIVRRAKRASNAISRMFSKREEEFESGDYEDVTSRANEMEDFSLSGFRPESKFITEGEAHSSSSLPYDDVDEAITDARPLTSKTAFAVVSGDIPEDALNRRSDGVAYENDDPQDNYDDIEESIETNQTRAEVHIGHHITPGDDLPPPPELLQEDVDYLVPGEDG
ncbi:scavenger receptor cysteine-rich type 1 protein M130 isoform X1 [Cheilinus undulatus]|uniref:scavenger receptor cysteine-rich type 1 protein M130 isoform X1 n=1 Tax=Cheilinus undulatus TaxID=241271 RepID=UPI001BD1E1F2|nr:scavenger receptor cysteine-rich type 1 protein M130 isoform X1 [Cheilinus undulatus]